VPYEGVVTLLQSILDARRTRLVVVTGRNAREVHSLLDLDPPPEVWGVHGAQRLRPDGNCETIEVPFFVVRAVEEAQQWLNHQGLGALAEIKPGSIAVHWRRFEQSAASELRARILLGWFRIAERGSLKLYEFDGGVEMRMADLDKGDAVRTVLNETGPDVPIAYLGDDTTDECAFRALDERGLTVLVRPAPRKTSAQVWIRPPEELLDFFSGWERATASLPKARTAMRSD